MSALTGVRIERVDPLELDLETADLLAEAVDLVAHFQGYRLDL